MEGVVNSIELLSEKFNHIYVSALNDKGYSNKCYKLENLRLIMHDINKIKENTDIHIQKIVFEKQMDMAQKFSDLANKMGPF